MVITQSKIFSAYVFSIYYIYVVRAVYPSGILNFLDDIVFLVLIATSFLFLKRKLLYINLLMFLLCFFILYYFVYGLFNGNDPLAPIMSLRYYKNFFLILIVSSLNNQQFDKTINIIKYALYVSIPISMYQFLTADRGNEAWWDEIGGILGRGGQSGTLSLLILVYVLFEYYQRIRDKKKIFDWYLLVLIPMFLNETKIVVVVIPVIFLLVSLVYGRETFTKIIFALPIFVFAAFAMNSAYVSFFNYSLFAAIDYEFIEGYFFADDVLRFQEVDVGRFMRLIYANEYLMQQSIIVQLFGEGLGSTFYGDSSGVEGKIVSEFFLLRLHTGSKIQLYQMMLEFGYVGSAIFISLLAYPWFKIAASKTRTNEEIVALVSIPVFLFGMMYQPVIETKAVSFLMCYSVASVFYKKYIQQR